MQYNWEEILANKTDQELFDIVCGHSLLPSTTVPLAKNELEKRNFDFSQIELHKKEWKLLKMEEEIDAMKSEIQRRTPITFKTYLFVVAGMVIFAAVLAKIAPMERKSLVLSLSGGIAFITLIAFLERLIYKLRMRSLQKLLEKKSKMG